MYLSLSLPLSLSLYLPLFFTGQVMFSHHSDETYQRSKVLEIALLRCSLNVFVIFIVFVFVFVFVVVFLLVRSCFLKTQDPPVRRRSRWSR